MAAFQRPGDRASSAFGIAFQSDRTSEDSSSVSAVANLQRRQQQTPAQRQQQAAGGGGTEAHQQAVLHAVEHHATTLLATDDAAGMAAVILQWLHRAGWTARQRRVACAHPTRLATVTAATSAADDCGLRVGAAIGYSIPFEEVASPGLTCMRHCMDETLLREVAASDPLLSNYRSPNHCIPS
mmetsp:Transcript_20811/g.62657  ORF Transcript_20811/g.62657 Transcript_20811/m.62657 type:complete len:183 (-) Transcript_20811:35-583(-)